MADDSLDELFETMSRIMPIMRRKVSHEVFRKALDQIGGDIASHHLMIMRMLDDCGMLHLADIGDEIGISRPQMTHSIDRLVNLGMVERQAHADDRRKINVVLTDKGRSELAQLDEILKEQSRTMLSVLNEEDVEKLNQALKDIVGVFAKLK